MQRLIVLAAAAAFAGQAADAVRDRYVPAPPAGQRIEGLLGERMKTNLRGRLLRVDETGLTEGFTNRPGKHAWIGEHAGKFLDAASNTGELTPTPELRQLADRIATALISSQLPDGYMGTYKPEDRWTSWDVWVQKYDLLGLLRYYQWTGREDALQAARGVGDLLVRDFGSGRRDILKAGTHGGLASASVLEPVVQLWRATGDKRYLVLANRIVNAWDASDGPRMLNTLLLTGNVYHTGNAKAYEMLSNLVGGLELYRATGSDELLRASANAWQDIVSKRLYITGTTSSAEHFHDDNDLPGDEAAHVGEGCVTTTWTQMNLQLLRLTGNPRYADQLERTVYNHMLGAQDPQNGNVCYFTPLNGRKQATPGINCCVSSIPRAISLIPQIAWGTIEGNPAVNLYTAGRAEFPGIGTIESKTDFPASGNVALTLTAARAGTFSLLLRVPSWSATYTATVGGRTYTGKPGEYLRIEREWSTTPTPIAVHLDMTVRPIDGGKSYKGFFALQRGPQILTLDKSANPDVKYLHRVTVDVPKAGSLSTMARAFNGKSVETRTVRLTPFSEATEYRVWIPRVVSTAPVPVTAFFATESTSSAAKHDVVLGSFTDERIDTAMATRVHYRQKDEKDWFAVDLREPREIRRIVFRHGDSTDKGGWFDTTGGKPEVQIRIEPKGEWQTVGSLATYPATTRDRKPAMVAGQAFELALPEKKRVAGIRVVGVPGGYYSSCSELQAYD